MEVDEACIPNISIEERRKRLWGGVIVLALSLIILTILVVTGINPWWRLGLFPLFAAAASGYFQWRDET